MNDYQILEKIGEGAHGIVLKAKYIISGQIFALKKIPIRNNSKEGIPPSIFREIKALEQLTHSNVIFKLIIDSGSSIVLVFEYTPSDLAQLLNAAQHRFSESQVKKYLQMLLKGVSYCHSRGVMHRDLKPANLLIGMNGELKLADFGLARLHQPVRPYSHQVATRWYRAPELLYGARVYDFGVDLWAVGCIFGELLNHAPLFAGQNDIDQLYSVISVLGTPTEETWPGMQQLPDFNKIQFSPTEPLPFEQVCPDAGEEALVLLQKFLRFESAKRIPAAQALLEPYFFDHPLPADISELIIPKKAPTPTFDVDVPLDIKQLLR